MVVVIGLIINVVLGIRISGVGVIVVVNCEGTTLSGRTLSGGRVLDTAVGTITV